MNERKSPLSISLAILALAIALGACGHTQTKPGSAGKANPKVTDGADASASKAPDAEAKPDRSGDEKNPFAEDEDLLAVAESDGSTTVRARRKIEKLEDGMVMVEVEAPASGLPECMFVARVLKIVPSNNRILDRLQRGRLYRFRLLLSDPIDLAAKSTADKMGACYYLPGTRLVLELSGVDQPNRALIISSLYLKAP